MYLLSTRLPITFYFPILNFSIFLLVYFTFCLRNYFALCIFICGNKHISDFIPVRFGLLLAADRPALQGFQELFPRYKPRCRRPRCRNRSYNTPLARASRHFRFSATSPPTVFRNCINVQCSRQCWRRKLNYTCVYTRESLLLTMLTLSLALSLSEKYITGKQESYCHI